MLLADQAGLFELNLRKICLFLGNLAVLGEPEEMPIPGTIGAARNGTQLVALSTRGPHFWGLIRICTALSQTVFHRTDTCTFSDQTSIYGNAKICA